MITPEQLAEWKALADKATPGPWAYEGVSEKANAASREAVSALIAEVERLHGFYAGELSSANEFIGRLTAEVERQAKRIAELEAENASLVEFAQDVALGKGRPVPPHGSGP